ncbi:hypothetical protein XI07_05190 [Bradyrhizobium sp. CCBAU 11445]|nr:hypothetical protein [Bradyrhizobium sp. CCBAU 11445]
MLSIASFTATTLSQEPTIAAAADDPFLWLEEIEGTAALAWARAENGKTLGVLQSDPRYRRFYEQALSSCRPRMGLRMDRKLLALREAGGGQDLSGSLNSCLHQGGPRASRARPVAAAKLAALGQPYFYYDNIDGEHNAAANLIEVARRLALEYSYASRRLCPE